MVDRNRVLDPGFGAGIRTEDDVALDPTAPTGSDPARLDAQGALTLLDWKHRIFDLYASVRADPDPLAAWQRWRAVRDSLFREHPQSPLPERERAAFDGLEYYEYEPAWRVAGEVEGSEPVVRDIASSTGGAFRFTRVGVVRFTLGGEQQQLELAWNEGYGGGLFLAFRDGTSRAATYSGGRYLLDTVKGADLGSDHRHRTVVLDFNFAYNPSCSYDPRWACPLAPSANALPLDITAGERQPVS